ncbi:hypothetical protein C8J57DRAFT_469090 [Mycena rebaudengoi]|nr:hypothetical protein C8J57DRAFT_469090 [Mycena rebaudengoi]
MRDAALELFLSVRNSREAALAFPRCVGGAQPRSRHSHSSSPTSRRALQPSRPSFQFLPATHSAACSSPSKFSIYSSCSRWRCSRSSIPSHHLTDTRRLFSQYFRFFDFIPNAPTARSAPPPHCAPPRCPPCRALLPLTRRPPLLLFYFPPSGSQLSSVATSRRRCAPLNRVRVPALPRDVTTAPAFVFGFSRLLSVAMPWRCAAPLTAPPCSFLFDFPPPHHRLLCVSMPRRRAAPYTCVRVPRLLRNVLKAPAARHAALFSFASPRPASQCLGGAHRPPIAFESSRACAASSPRRPPFFYSILRRPRGRSAFRRFIRPAAPLSSRPTLHAPARRYQRGAGLACPPAYIHTNCADSLYWIFLPLRGAGPPRASSPKFLR